MALTGKFVLQAAEVHGGRQAVQQGQGRAGHQQVDPRPSTRENKPERPNPEPETLVSGRVQGPILPYTRCPNPRT
eukprot:308515-Rhodomonas_salina.3